MVWQNYSTSFWNDVRIQHIQSVRFHFILQNYKRKKEVFICSRRGLQLFVLKILRLKLSSEYLYRWNAFTSPSAIGFALHVANETFSCSLIQLKIIKTSARVANYWRSRWLNTSSPFARWLIQSSALFLSFPLLLFSTRYITISI